LARVYTGISWLLLLLASIEMITSPLTQQIWTWDRFLHGGQDFETSALFIVTCLCLALLLAQLCRQAMSLLPAAASFFERASHGSARDGSTRKRFLPSQLRSGSTSRLLGPGIFPLQV
jgi:hypothetical protein